jgi:hypothetical protein
VVNVPYPDRYIRVLRWRIAAICQRDVAVKPEALEVEGCVGAGVAEIAASPCVLPEKAGAVCENR